MKVSDTIEAFIKEMLENSDGPLELQRNELAGYFRCAPSQINYVLSTRFSMDRGYLIESQKGGGGYIRIICINMDKNDYILRQIDRVGQEVGLQEAIQIIRSLADRGIVDNTARLIMESAIQNDALMIPSSSIRDAIRASVLRSMLVTLVKK